MADYLKLFETHSQYEAYMEGEIALPNVSHCISENEVHYNPYVHDYSQDYFTTIAKESGTITFAYPSGGTTDVFTSMSYKKNDGEWVTTQYSPNNGNTINVSVNNGDKVQWKGINNVFYDESSDSINYFTSDCHVDVEGNIMSLLYGDNFSDKRSLEGRDGAFCSLFNCYDGVLYIVSAENLLLPATTLSEYCYATMFLSCTSLTTAPELPATTLAGGCYQYMFQGCTNLSYIKAMFTTTPSADYTNYWVDGVASTGTFIKNASATWATTGVSGIPTGWTVQTASTPK